MSKPVKLLFQNEVVAELSGFRYQTPWASAKAVFKNLELAQKLENINIINLFDLDLEDKELPEDEEDRLWNEKLIQLGLTPEDFKLDRDEHWRVVCDDGRIDEVRALKLSEGIIVWRA